jgi:uncharacterized protein YbcC (UPF0753/DUF2309 family)
MIKNGKVEPGIPQKVVHIDGDALFENAEFKVIKPQYELVPATDVEESLTSELVDLNHELKKAKKNKNKELIKQLESKMEAINDRLYDIVQTVVVE